MGATVGTLEQLAGELARVFEPLGRRIEEESVDELLPWLGLRMAEIDVGSTDLNEALTTSATVAATLEPVITQLAQAVDQDDRVTIATSTAALLQHFRALLQAVEQIMRALQSLGTNPSLTSQQQAELTTFATVFSERLLHRLFVDYLEARFPQIALLLIAMGAIEIVREPGLPGGSLHGPYTRKTFHLGRIAKLLTDPTGLLREVYRWGDPAFDGQALFTMFQTLLREKFGIPAEILRPPGEPALLEAFGFNAEVNPALSPPGLDVTLRMPTSVDRTETAEEGDWLATFDMRLHASGDLAATIRPLFDLELHLPRETTADLRLGAAFSRTNSAASFVMLGAAGGSRLEMQGLSASVRIDMQFSSSGQTRMAVDPAVEFSVTGGKAVLDFSQADGFLARIFQDKGFTVSFDLTGGWSMSRGGYLRGGAGLEATIPVHLDLLGTLSIETIYLSLQSISHGIRDGLELVAATTATIKLGPITATVERVGFTAALRFPSGGGNLGVANLDLGFKPPTGLGVVIDTPVVVGGGYLRFDPQTAEYSGIIQLEVAETIAVKAIGLLTTRLPGGAKGYSLLVLISAEGFAPIQLGLGFTLTGIGGLLGVNRTARVDVLRNGLKQGTLGSVLFPQDPIRNAPQIVSDLRAVFPPAPNRFLFGPMAIIGWGTPTILTLELALILELPAPVRLIILGRLLAVLPDAAHAVVRVRMDAIGVIDFNRGEVSLDAVLYDSRILAFALTGEMALRASWGKQPRFVLAIGGFHPRFAAPADFPKLKRLALSISDSDSLRLRCDAYLALTSNTVQFGARVELHAAGGGFSFDGYLGFDALFQLAPFAFVVDLAAGIALRYHGRLLMGIHFEGRLSGPTPWHIQGKATIKIWFFKVTVDFKRQFGPDVPPPVPAPLEVRALVVAAVQDARNWSGALPGGEHPLVSLRDRAGSGTILFVHPLAEVTVRQRVVPLNRVIDKVGSAPVRGERQFTLQAIRADQANGNLPLATTPVHEAFAVAQYQEMRDEEKLARPSFESQEAGLRLGSETVAYAYDPVVDDAIAYETELLVPGQGPEPPAPARPRYTMTATVLEAVVITGAAGQAAIRRRGRTRQTTGELVV